MSTRLEPLRILIVDDEPIARSGLREMLSAYPDAVVVGEVADGVEAVPAVRALVPDLLFLDVQMPEADGFALLERLQSGAPPAIVFVTAYEEYAFPAFEANAVDYLLKPFDHSRLRRALDRAIRFLGADRERQDSAEYRTTAWRHSRHRFVVRDRGAMTFIEPQDVEWIESWGNYVRLFVNGRPMLLRESTNAVAERLDQTRFVRISRRVIVNADHVERLIPRPNGQTEIVLRSALVLLGSRRWRERLRAFFGAGESRRRSAGADLDGPPLPPATPPER
jgi:two-component system LytT family response regulator